MIYLLLPAYNEAENLPGLLGNISHAFADRPYRVFVVDDGSDDGTEEVLRGIRLEKGGGLEVLRHEKNKGLAQAMRTGLARILPEMEKGDVLVTMDADGSHPAAQIAPLAEAVEAGAGLAVASRFAPGGGEIGLALPRRILSRGACFLLRRFFPIPGCRDYTCGFRAYSREALLAARQRWGERLMESPGFTCMAELLIKIGWILRFSVSEIPFLLRYDWKRGKSKIRVFPTIAQYLWLIRHLRRQR